MSDVEISRVTAAPPPFAELKRAEWLACNTVVRRWEKDTCLRLWQPERAASGAGEG